MPPVVPAGVTEISFGLPSVLGFPLSISYASTSVWWVLLAAVLVFLFGIRAGAEIRSRCPRRQESAPPPPPAEATWYDCGRGRFLPPHATRTGKRYYGLRDRLLGHIGVYAGWGKLAHEVGEKIHEPASRGGYIGVRDLEEAVAFVARSRPEYNQVTLYV